MKRKTLLLVAVFFLFTLFAISFFAFPRYSGRYSKTTYSILNTRKVIFACLAYHDHPTSGGKYPGSLSDLIHPPFGGGPFTRDSKDELEDAWGNPLRYALVPNEKGDLEPYVWAERNVKERLYLVGAKGTADGQVVLFGLPE